MHFIDFDDLDRLVFDRQFDGFPCGFDPAENGSMAHVQEPSDDSKASSFKIHLAGKLPGLRGFDIRFFLYRVAIPVMFTLVTLPPCDDTIFAVCSAATSGIIH